MAGKIKHIQRSHRSHGKNNYVFAKFEANAVRDKGMKVHKRSLFQRFAGLFRRNQSR